MRESSVNSTGIGSIAVIGNYLPRLCGIATFTRDLVESISSASGNPDCWAIAMNDREDGYDYPGNVRYEIDQNNPEAYRRAADFLKAQKADLVCLQHEYGIFGGPAGSHILELLRNLRIPVVTTLHTVLIEPPGEYYRVMMHLVSLSDRVVVMSRRAVDILQTVYDVPQGKIEWIPHGIPDMPFMDPSYNKERLGKLGKKLLLTFGLLSPNKGIEYALQALPAVVEQIPDLHYTILGQTHPHIVKEQGEAYRESLIDRVKSLGLEGHVSFEDRFVSQSELLDYLSAADLYLTPYIGEAQITSGTLAYAMATGKAVVSTPYWYAEEMLSGGRGELVPFRDSETMARSVIRLLRQDEERHQMRIRAYDHCRNAVWSEVARRYLELFDTVRREQLRRPRLYPSSSRLLPSTGSTPKGWVPKPLSTITLPSIRIGHLVRMTDDTGLFQHAAWTTPDRDFGYCTDDNSRALLLTAQLRRMETTDPIRVERLHRIYLSFLLHALDEESGRFRNFMNFNREWTERVGSPDAHGRAVWALGQALALEESEPDRQLLGRLFRRSMKPLPEFESLRTVAFSLIGLDGYLTLYPGDSEAKRCFSLLAERLHSFFMEGMPDEWPWPEETLTYANAKLPHALLIAGRRLNDEMMTASGLDTLRWLLEIQTENGHLAPIGNRGWYRKGGEKARFDQQPIEAHALTEACLEAWRVSGDNRWLGRATLCFNWFLGRNDLNLPLYEKSTGGCRDGLESDGVNQNQGAESTLSWLLSLTAMHRMAAERDAAHPTGTPHYLNEPVSEAGRAKSAPRMESRPGESVRDGIDRGRTTKSVR